MRSIVMTLVLVAALGGRLARAGEAQPGEEAGAPDAPPAPAPESPPDPVSPPETPASTALDAVRPKVGFPRARRPPEAADPGARIAAEGIVGLLLATGGEIGGGFLGFYASESSTSFRLGNAFIGAGVGATLGAWSSVMLVGQVLHGKGNPAVTFLGSLGGALLSLAVVVPVVTTLQSSDSALFTLAAAAALFAPPAGAILGYELSQPQSPDSTIAPPVQLTPSISLAPGGRGGGIGIAGTF